MDTSLLPRLLGIAVLLPLISFFVILVMARWWKPATGGYVATAAIVSAGILSVWSLAIWLTHHPMGTDAGYYTGDYYLLGQFGKLKMTISYYIDSLTVVMFCMVSLIASCIHFYSLGYMHDELHTMTDHEVTLENGSHLKRPGRFSRFFQYMSLFCFSMLGLVLAGNVAMVFVFWELVGICSYFLIGFYIERKSASNAANKAFIVNRIGDFGMIIGLMAVWAGLGTFAFGDVDRDRNGSIEIAEQGIFTLVRPASRDHALTTPDGMVLADAQSEIQQWGQTHPTATKCKLIFPASWTICVAVVPTEPADTMVTGCWWSPGWASSVDAWARVLNFRCTSGYPMRWRDRPLCRPSCIQRRWSRRASIWWAVSIRYSLRKSCW
jgi:NADH-quinone oxidoreductase subunit L